MEERKVCITCGQEKLLAEFFRDVARPDGRRSDCKVCHYKVVQKSVLKRKGHFARSPVVEKCCGHCHTIKSIGMFSRNVSFPDGYTQYCKKCLVKTVRERKHLTTWWYRRCFGKGRAIQTNEVAPVEIKELFMRDTYCAYCRLDMRDQSQYNIHLDHKHPRSRGGSDKIENLCISCKDCNRMKHDRTEAEFREFLKEYVARFKPENVVKLFPLANHAAKETQA